jgi:hypothetical protein
MAHNTVHSYLSVNAMLDALATRLNGGVIRLYNGTQPANADVAVGAQTLGAELTFGSPAFGAAANGVITANAITDDSSADAAITPTWARCLRSGGINAEFDCTVGATGSSSDIEFDIATFVATGRVKITSFSYTMAR